MKKILLLPFFVLSGIGIGQAQVNIDIKNPQIPILKERQDNVLFYIREEAPEQAKLDRVEIEFSPETPLDQIQSVRLNYGGMEGVQNQGKTLFYPVEYLHRITPEFTRKANPTYFIPLDEVAPVDSRKITLAADKLMPAGVNYFWVSLETQPDIPLLSTIEAKVSAVYVDGRENKIASGEGYSVRRLGSGLRFGGDDGSVAYRIPGLVTTPDGTLIAVYDIRHNTGRDLQEYVSIGMSRSRDGGETWEPMRTIMDFGESNGMPRAQNGTGDPAVLVDRTTGAIWVVALWANGMGHGLTWFNSAAGMDVGQTAQLMMVTSNDDGLTWSEPINVTDQMKDPSWTFFYEGPGSGITMADGTLVFANQYKDANGLPHAGIMYSKDHGKTWTTSAPARDDATESQVVELTPGVLMLNMRDNRGGSRAVSVTSDMGKTWTEHPSSRSALIEPVCMASLIKSDDNALGRPLLFFSNPDRTDARTHMTVKTSLDNGMSWPVESQVMLDEEEGWGYSCLTMIDPNTVGILYEGSTAMLVFQKIKLDELIKN